MERNGADRDNVTHMSPVTVSRFLSLSPTCPRKVRRTVNTPTAAETLSAWHKCRAVSERRAGGADVHTDGARTRREVRQIAPGLPVRRVVIRRGARLEYEDAQARICCRKTACDHATSSATYRMSSVKSV